jgi:septum site-determining protein MinD
MNKESKAGEAFSRIAMRLNGQPDLPIDIPTSNVGFFKRIGRKIGLSK